jgi:hypothetical protein
MSHHQAVIKLFIDKILPHKLLQYRTRQIYIAVLGGVNLIRCSSGQGETFDIDIKFIIKKTIKDTSDPLFVKATEIRNTFIQDIYNSAKDIIEPFVTLSIVETDLGKLKGTRLCIYASYNTQNEKMVLIDTGIFSNATVQHFDKFENFYSKLKIPYYIDRRTKIPYATCSWQVIDTVRMMHFSKEMLESAKRERDMSFWNKKYLKYASKFLLLYTHYNKANNAFIKTYRETIQHLKENKELNKEELENVLMETNLKKILERFLNPPSINKCHKKIIDYVLKHVLGKYMKATSSHYPVILGGADVNRCISPLFNVIIKDIDLQYVLIKDDDFDQVVSAKGILLKSLLMDKDLQDFLDNLEIEFGYRIKLRKNDIDPIKYPIHGLLQLSVIVAEFYNPNEELVHSMNLIDAVIFSKSTVENSEWHTYDKFIDKDMVAPVPYFINKDNVIYASCNWAYFNTIQMLMLYRDNIEVETSSFMIAKYGRYLMKYAALYIVKHPDDSNIPRLLKLYKEVQHIVRGTSVKHIFDKDKMRKLFTDIESLTDLKTDSTKIAKLLPNKIFLS